jgi:hypothetical protein
MLRLVLEVLELTHGYVRHGGKRNRRQQRDRMVTFAEFAASMGARSLGQVGGRHVIEYWRRHRSLSPSTAYNHWLAICTLWELAGKAGKPPRPRVAEADVGAYPPRIVASGSQIETTAGADPDDLTAQDSVSIPFPGRKSAEGGEKS